VIANGIVAMEGNGPLNGTPRHLANLFMLECEPNSIRQSHRRSDIL